MKKLIGSLLIVGAVLAAVSLSAPKAEAKAVGASIQGIVRIGQPSQVTFKIQNNSGMSLRNFVVWFPTSYQMLAPGHNRLIRNRNYGPWSTVVVWDGNSLRNNYNALWFKATNGTRAIPQGGWEKFPVTIKTPTNVRMYPQNVKVYWQADNGRGQYFRGSTYMHVRN